MDDIDKLETLGDDVDALERSLADASAMTAAFDDQLRGMQGALAGTTRDLGKLERGFSSGLRRAFDGLLLDGVKLSDALTGLANSMLNTAYSAAIDPVTNQLGGILADGLNGAVSSILPFKDGAPFSQGRVVPFARGGVVGGPTTFPIQGGVGLMGEAGPEAIMPLERGPDGRLGVRSQGGRAVNVTMNISTPDARSFERSKSQIATNVARALGRSQRNR